MKHLKKFNEALSTQDLIDGVNDICEELNDNGFYDFCHSIVGGNNWEHKKVQIFKTFGKSLITFKKDDFFYFSEISDVIYRIKDFVGIDKILSMKVYLGNIDPNCYEIICLTVDKQNLNNETLFMTDNKRHISKIVIYFNF